MEEKLKRGELKNAILNVLSGHQTPISALVILNKLNEIGIDTTENSLYVTLNNMRKNGTIRRDYYHSCPSCHARHMGYLKCNI